MFTGIIEEIGTVVELHGALRVTCRKVFEDSEPGASLAVNGVCLTVTDRSLPASGGQEGVLSFDLSPETLGRSSLGRLGGGDRVNLERAATLLTRLGGHLVQGHVDGVGHVRGVEDSDLGRDLMISVPEGLSRYIVEKGSVAVDGVSLTVSGVGAGVFRVSLVPFTLGATTLGALRTGDPVNLEVDVLAKYAEALLGRPA